MSINRTDQAGFALHVACLGYGSDRMTNMWDTYMLGCSKHSSLPSKRSNPADLYLRHKYSRVSSLPTMTSFLTTSGSLCR